MNYSKVDGALAAALGRGEIPLDAPVEVSVRTELAPDEMQQQELENLGVQGVGPNRKLFTARVNLHKIERLTELPWIRLVSLSQSLRMLAK